MVRRGFLVQLAVACVFITFITMKSALGAPYTMTNGPGDGTLTVGLDGYGAFGLAIGADATDAFYDPLGAIGPTATSFESGVAIGFGGTRSFLTSGLIGTSGGLPNPATAGTPTSGTSSFSFGVLSFTLTETLTGLFAGPMQTGSILTQTYLITNTGTSLLGFDLVRYLDGDLEFDGSLIDGGGLLGIVGSGAEILFETDSATGASTSTTFVGITGTGGTTPVTNRFEISSFSGLRSSIIAGSALGDFILGDSADADFFIDAGAGYDVTLALRNVFSLGVGASTTYTTTTFFGSGSPTRVRPVPEPSTLTLWSLGAVALFGLGWRRRKRVA